MIKKIKVNCLIKGIIVNYNQAIKVESEIQSWAVRVDEVG